MIQLISIQNVICLTMNQLVFDNLLMLIHKLGYLLLNERHIMMKVYDNAINLCLITNKVLRLIIFKFVSTKLVADIIFKIKATSMIKPTIKIQDDYNFSSELLIVLNNLFCMIIITIILNINKYMSILRISVNNTVFRYKYSINLIHITRISNIKVKKKFNQYKNIHLNIEQLN